MPAEVAGVTEAASVRMTLASACSLLRDGAVRCWGANNSGQLGDGTSEARLTAAPVDILGRALQLDVADMGCVRLATGEVACWGPDHFGWAGEPGNIYAPAIVKNVSHAASVWLPGQASFQLPGTSCVIGAGGALSCTGENDLGNIDFDIPHDLENGDLKTIDGVTDAIQVAGTFSSTCALRAAGSVVCWGTNNAGVLGIGSFEQPDAKVVTVTGIEGALHLAAGRGHMCAALGSGGVACWGDNGAGQLGDGTTQDRPAPVHVLGLP